MATTWTPSGRVLQQYEFLFRASVEGGGSVIAGPGNKINKDKTWDADGGTQPTFGAACYGVLVAAAGDWLLAHATDPFQGMGSATWLYPGVAPSGALKLKRFHVWNNETVVANFITLRKKTANGLPIWSGTTETIQVDARGEFLWVSELGTATITTAGNDGVTVAVGAGSPALEVLLVFGT